MKPFTLKKRKKREVWVVKHGAAFNIQDANTMATYDGCDWSGKGETVTFRNRPAAEAYAKSKGWRVV